MAAQPAVLRRVGKNLVKLQLPKEMAAAHPTVGTNLEKIKLPKETPAQPVTMCRVGKNLVKRQLPRTYPQWKIDLGKEITQQFESIPKILIFHYNALSNQEWIDLRYDMRQENMKVKVYPNRITCHYLKQTIYANLCSLFCTDTAVAFGDDDINMKAVVKIFRDMPKVELLGAKIDNALLNRQQVIDYSNLPSLEHCRGELVQLLSQPSIILSQLLQSNQMNLAQSLSLYVEQQNTPVIP